MKMSHFENLLNLKCNPLSHPNTNHTHYSHSRLSQKFVFERDQIFQNLENETLYNIIY